jgi:hypothetical protein
MKKIIQASVFLSIICTFLDAGTLTNNGNISINVVMYKNYQVGSLGNSPKGRTRGQGYTIPSGQNIDIENGVTSIDIFYSAEKPGIHANINANNSYMISPDTPTWTITLGDGIH